MRLAADKANAAREQFMHRAIAQARRSFAAGGPPVGACLVRNGEVIAEAHNGVIADLDITAHAEIALLRVACRDQRALRLTGCELYVTVEPCLMCFSASAYAGIDAIYYGAPIDAMQVVTGAEVAIGNFCDHHATDGASLPDLHSGVLEAECMQLLDQWAEQRP